MNNVKVLKRELSTYVSRSLSEYNTRIHSRIKPTIDELKFKEEYQGRIIDCMVGEVDDNYIETPETNAPIVKLEHSKEGLVKVPSIKGKTILLNADGNETDTPAEGCKLVSVGEDEDNKLIILSKNRNLFNSEEFYNDWKSKASNYIYKENLNGEDVFKIMDGSLLWGKDKGYKVRVEKGKTYKLSIMAKMITSTTNNVILIRNGTKTVSGFHVWDEGDFYKREGIFVAEEDYIYVCSGYNGHNYFYIKDIQLTEQPYSDTFIPHQSHKTEILLNEPLRSLPNGVKDEIVDNQLIRRVGKMSFSDLNKIKEPTTIVWGTGNSHGAYQWMSMSSCNGTGSNIINYKYRNNKITPNIVNNLYPYDTSWHGGNSNGSPQGLPSVFFGISNDGHIRLMVSKSLINPTEPSTVKDAEFKKWVEENLNLDAEFIYELEEPIIEEFPNGITLQGFDDTTMYIENSITPTVQYGYNALIPYKEELSNQKEEVETNTLDIEQNIIPYLMDMEFNLMLMEDNE